MSDYIDDMVESIEINLEEMLDRPVEVERKIMWCARTCGRYECSVVKENSFMYFVFNRLKDVPKDVLKITNMCHGWAPKGGRYNHKLWVDHNGCSLGEVKKETFGNSVEGSSHD